MKTRRFPSEQIKHFPEQLLDLPWNERQDSKDLFNYEWKLKKAISLFLN